MIKRFHDLSLRTRMLSAFGVVAALLLVVGGIGFWGSPAQSGAATEMATSAEKLRELVGQFRLAQARASGQARP